MPEFQELSALGATDHRGVELRNAGHRLVPVRHRSPEHFPQIAIDAQDHCQKTSKKSCGNLKKREFSQAGLFLIPGMGVVVARIFVVVLLLLDLVLVGPLLSVPGASSVPNDEGNDGDPCDVSGPNTLLLTHLITA